MTDPLQYFSEFLESLAADEPAPVIVESWRRCTQAGVDSRAPVYRRVDDAELQRRQQQNRGWLDLADPHLSWLTRSFQHVDHVVYITDADGIVLRAAGSAEIMEAFHLSPGHDWSEEQMGTNGAGTALAAGRPVAVVGPDHVVESFEDCTCTGAPIFAPDGSLVGAVDVSTAAGDAQPDRVFVVAHVAYTIGRELAARQQAARASRQVAESESRLATALDVAALGVWEYDPQRHEVSGDERWAEVLAVPPGRRFSLNETFDIVHPDDRDTVMSQVLSAGAAGGTGVFEAEFRIESADGRLRWLVVRGRALGLRDGRITGAERFIGTVRDVTGERKLSAERDALLDRERELRGLLDAIFGSAPVGIGFWDRELRFQRVNQYLAELNGLPIEAHLGKRPDELLPDVEGLDQIMAQWRRVLDTGEPLKNVEVRGRTQAPTEEERVWLEHFFPVRADNQIIGLGAVVEDVTERERAQRALRESENRYRTLFESMAEAFCIIEKVADDPVDFRYVEVNPAFKRQSGVDAVLGRTIREVLPEEAPGWIEIYDAILRTGKSMRFERPLKAQSKVLELFAFRVVDETRARVAVIFVDVTHRKRTEAMLRESDRAKDEFLAVLGHELRNPLAPLRTGLDLMEQARRRPELLDSLRPMMDRQLSHLVRLVDDLLDISRISRGRIDLKKAPVDVHAPVEAAVEQVRGLIDERRHRLVMELCAKPLFLQGDFERLTQIFANLLSNAARYSDPEGTIVVASEAQGDTCTVRVRDTGYGIPPEHSERLFQLFSQISEHRSQTGGGGLGIGLALSRQLLEMHGGTISVRSEGAGRGSEFIVTLPLDRNHRTAASEPGEMPGRTHRRRVLVVDDNQDAALGLAMLLELQGHTAHAAHDGPAALELVEAAAPEIVLLDLGLPGMDGIEVARRIRSMSGGNHVRIVAVTGWGQDVDRQRTRDAGFDDHLTKPIQLTQLEPILG